MNRYTHLGVYGALVKNDRILLIRKARGPHTGKWDLPGGSIEFGEEPYAALQREFLEETGITQLAGTIRAAVSYTLIYPYKPDELEELHHIGILYDVELISDDYVLKADGDDQDSLGACWIDIAAIRMDEPPDEPVGLGGQQASAAQLRGGMPGSPDCCAGGGSSSGQGGVVVTPFVKEAIKAYRSKQESDGEASDCIT